MSRKRTPYVTARPLPAPRLPTVPGRSRLRDKFGGLPPDIPVPNTEPIPDFERRLAQWQAVYPAGSVPEFIVWDYLTRIKGWRPGIEFEYQLPIIGGRTRFGGFVADYYIRPGNMVWNVQGLRYHLEQARDRAKVQAQAAELTSRGYTVIQLWEDDLLERPEYVLEAALRGQESNRHKDEAGIYV
jgi:very-short-patch-repair endonuclease